MTGAGKPRILLGSIALEPKRWAPVKTPSYPVSAWLPRFFEDGFDGVELWGYHWENATPAEQTALREKAAPLAIYSAYCGFDEGQEDSRRQAAQGVHELQAQGVKFNVGNNQDKTAVYIETVREWAAGLPDGTRLLCECHPGTLMERADAAKRFFDAWPEERFQALVHPVAQQMPGMPPLQSLQAWIDALGGRITHAHMQLRDTDDDFIALERNEQYVRDALTLMRDAGFCGTITLEFTAGTRAPDQTPESLYTAIVRDLEFLRALLEQLY